MEYIVKQGKIVEWRNNTLEYVSSIKLDENMVHVEFTDRIVLFIANDTTVNNALCTSANEIINELNK